MNTAALVGVNREYTSNRIPHISELKVDTIDIELKHADTVVIGNKSDDFEIAVGKLKKGQELFDFVRIANLETDDKRYEDISR